MASKWTWAFGLGGLGLAAWLATGKRGVEVLSAPAGPGVTLAPGAPLQTRPLPAWASLSADGQASYVRRMQEQLAWLSYGSSAATGAWDAATTDAVNQFLAPADNANAARAYNWGSGGGDAVDRPAVIRAVDDFVRVSSGAPQASDYLPMVASTSGVSGAVYPVYAPAIMRPSNPGNAPPVPLPLRNRAARPSG